MVAIERAHADHPRRGVRMTTPLVIPPLPPSAPRTGNAAGRWFGRTVLRLGGWRIAGTLPDMPKAVFLAAPHSSAWDAVWGLAAKLALGMHVEFMAKRELFWFPLGPLLRFFGAIPTDRSGPRGVVGGMVQRLAERERLWLAIAPEGTRRRVVNWKTGFWHIATQAGVPVVCAYFHYPERTVGFSEPMVMTGVLEDDMARIRAFYVPWIGKNRGTT